MSVTKIGAPGWSSLLPLERAPPARRKLSQNRFWGCERIYQTETSPRPLKINVAEIDLSAPGISFRTTPRAAGYPGPNINGSPGRQNGKPLASLPTRWEPRLRLTRIITRPRTSDTSWANNLGLTGSNGDIYSPWEGGRRTEFS